MSYDFNTAANAAKEEQGAPPKIHAPLPLSRPPLPSEPYPIDALGPLVSETVQAVAGETQVPIELAAGSALSFCSLVTQAHANITLAHGSVAPITLFLLTVAGSGDRKSEVDKYLGKFLNVRAQETREDFNAQMKEYLNDLEAYKAARAAAVKGKDSSREAIKARLEAVGEEPKRPLEHIFLASDPTIEGMHKHLMQNQPTQGIFNDEGGQFTGGHAMNKDNAVKTATGLSKMWDGKEVQRVRSADGMTVIRGKRVSVHLMMQPLLANEWLADPILNSQGLFARFLIASPKTLAGHRFFGTDKDPAWIGKINDFNRKALDIIRMPLPYDPDDDGALKPRTISLTIQAQKCLQAFHNKVEKQLGEEGALEVIKPLGSKATEHAARLAAVLTLFENIQATMIDGDAAGRACRLMDWYLQEALRLNAAAAVPEKLRNAQKLLNWLHGKWVERSGQFSGPLYVSPTDIYQFGPYAIRNAGAAKPLVEILVAHKWLKKVSAREVNGMQRADVYQVERAA